jgi:hypothetical protein
MKTSSSTPVRPRSKNQRALFCGALAALTLLKGVTLTAETSYRYQSEPGDYIGGGQSNRYNSKNATIGLSGTAENLTFSVVTQTEFWFLQLAAPAGELLHPGHYYDAERASFRTGRAPGLDVSGDGRGCNQVWGGITINQIEADANGTVTLLDATFIHQCESSTAPRLFGAGKYNASPLSYSFISDPGDYIGGGVSKSYAGATSLFSLSGTDTYLQYGVSGERDNWTAIMRPPTGQHLGVGTYETTRFGDATHAGLDVFGDGRGCNTSTGTLTINEISFDGAGNVTRLNSTFEQHCEGGSPALHGTIHFYR